VGLSGCQVPEGTLNGGEGDFHVEQFANVSFREIERGHEIFGWLQGGEASFQLTGSECVVGQIGVLGE
jgi:hypothetical protein